MSTPNDNGFNLPDDLTTVDPKAVVGQRSAGYGRGAFVTRVPEPGNNGDAAAMAALTEHRQPPDSQYLVTGLPSLCALYTGSTDNSIGVRRFNNDDVLKIYDARAEKSLRMLAEAVGATLDGFSIWDLTVGDFWYLMYWHRLHSYPKNPFIVSWTCTADPHLQDVRDEKISVKTLEQEMILKNSDLDIVELDVPGFTTLLEKIKTDFGVTATAMRMGDYVRLIEMEDENEEAMRKSMETQGKSVPKYRASDFLRARHAAHLSSVHGASLEQRSSALMTLADFSLWPWLDKVATGSEHGVRETYGVRCAVCNTRAEVEVALDALTFLPEL